MVIRFWILGCGWGQFTALMKESGHEATGLDIFEKAFVQKFALNKGKYEKAGFHANFSKAALTEKIVDSSR